MMNEEEEIGILESYEKGEWRSINNLREEIARYQAYAQDTLTNMGIVTIQLSPEDLKTLKRKGER